MVWNEDEYTAYLGAERRRFAWVMVRHGGLSPDQAEAAALKHYPYEASDAKYRELVFHDRAWHWAMLTIHGDQYWIKHPELEQPSAEYMAVG